MNDQAELLAKCVVLGIRLSMKDENQLRIDGLPNTLKPELIERLKSQKEKILLLMKSNELPLGMRDKIRAAMLERVNATYLGRAINWPKLTVIEQRIQNAKTLTELLRAVADFENTVNEE